MKPHFLALALLLAPLGLVTIAEAESVQTTSGLVTLAGASGERQILLGGRVFPIPGSASYAAFEEQVGDFILLQLGSGARACPASFVWFDARPGALRFSETFGTCADLVEVSWDDRRLIVEMADITQGRGTVAYDFDGQRITERVVATAPVAQQPIPPGLSLIGRHPLDVIGDAAFEDAFVALMGAEALRRARLSLQLAQGMVAEGDWAVARACQQIDCPGYFGALAVSMDGSRVLVALKGRDQPGQLWGSPAGPVPQEVLGVLTAP